jgi:hypothetical protein
VTPVPQAPSDAAAPERWFVYYRLPTAQEAEVIATVRELQARVARRCGIRGRLLGRRDDSGATVTLMEIYEPVADVAGFADALAAAVAASALTSALREARHVERFIEIRADAPCA